MTKRKKTSTHHHHDILGFTSDLYELSALNLFERAPSEDYIQEWTEALMQPLVEEGKNHHLSVLIFRLGQEWLALPTVVVKEVTHRRSMHRIPHRSNKVLLGVVNLNGELKLYVSLSELLAIPSEPTSVVNHRIPYQQNRMIAIAKDDDLWVFPVEEIEGIYIWDLSILTNVPVNISKSTANYMKGIMIIENKSVGLLDESLLFSGLRRSISETF